jgi:crotonobetainyl-CoA:carnitine CoA-transferase CaiB-like acyl-CoA transferase
VAEDALADIRVLELGSMLAGPFAGSMLADFGADVIKVEKPGKPDPLKEWPPHRDGVPLWWKTMARGKRLVTLDISKPAARDLALGLMQRSDIVIENFKPGTLERWGFDPAALRDRFPHLIWVRVSGYGQTGPYRQRGGYATVAEGFSGLASFTGFPDRGPMVSAFPLGDYLAGLFGAFGAMVALHVRAPSGRGQVVDVSLFEPLLRIIEAVVVRYDQTGEAKPRLGNQMEEDVPRNVYATKDGGFIAVSCGSQRIFENLLAALNRLDLKDDPRFATMAARVAHRDAIDRVVADWMEGQTIESALETLARCEVVAGRINTIADVLGDMHVAAREAVATLVDRELGPVRMPTPVPRLGDTPGRIRWTGGASGEDNEAVFRGLLGLDRSAIEGLARDKVI